MKAAPAFPASHFLLAIAIMAVWGTNFVVIKLALAHLPPLTLALLRFVCVLIPAVFILPRPKVAWASLAAYGLLIGAGQFGLLFTAMRGSITPGLASLVVQTQVVFTIALAVLFGGERIAPAQVVAVLVAGAGLALIVLHTDGSATPLGLILVLAPRSAGRSAIWSPATPAHLPCCPLSCGRRCSRFPRWPLSRWYSKGRRG